MDKTETNSSPEFQPAPVHVRNTCSSGTDPLGKPAFDIKELQRWWRNHPGFHMVWQSQQPSQTLRDRESHTENIASRVPKQKTPCDRWNSLPEISESWKKQCQIVLSKSCTKQIFHELHDELCHMGYQKTLYRARMRYYWPGMTSDIDRWCTECDTCQRRQGPTPRSRAFYGRWWLLVQEKLSMLTCLNYLRHPVETSMC